MEAFRPLADEMFLDRVVEYLRQKHSQTVLRLPSGDVPVEQLRTETLRTLAERGIARSRAFGLKAESSLIGFVVIMLLVGPSFDAHPAIGSALSDHSIAPELRIRRLCDVTTDDVWQEARNAYDPAAWASWPS
jgi:hypothetical protein